ncbi:MAG: DUF5763 domain-containing protein [Chloroflexota bacterium]|nr:DUF5763 domain-containing protein [Chloroflexota bacterium]
MASKCQGTNATGEPCSARPILADGYCYWHSPARAADRAENNRRGGLAKSNKARAKKAIPEALTTEELAGWLSVAFKRVLAGSMEPGVATAVATVAKAMLAVNEAGALERFEERLSQLERATRRGWSA